jgi:thiaminase (transcriptional activator TenA)
MKFTLKLWNETKGIYEKIIQLPFNQELMKGTLDMNRFMFYIRQDSLYLMDYCKVLALIASKMEKTERTLQFLKFAEDSIIVEKTMHENFLSGYKKGDMQYQKSPSCFAYTNFLLSTVAFRSTEEAIASILPCFWIYREVGNYIYNNAAKNNPYKDWINTYSAEEFRKATDIAIESTDEMADQASSIIRSKMIDVFVISTKLEYLFWESAYKKEKWIV